MLSFIANSAYRHHMTTLLVYVLVNKQDSYSSGMTCLELETSGANTLITLPAALLFKG